MTINLLTTKIIPIMLKLTKKELSVLELTIPRLTLAPSRYCVVCSVRSNEHILYVERFNTFRWFLRQKPSAYSDTLLFKYTLVELY